MKLSLLTVCIGKLASFYAATEASLGFVWGPGLHHVEAGKKDERRNFSKELQGDLRGLSAEELALRRNVMNNALMREMARVQGWSPMEDLDNSPFDRGVSTLDQLSLEQMVDLVSSWAQVKRSDVEFFLVHPAQFQYILNLLRISVKTKVGKDGKHRSLRLTGIHLRNERDAAEVKRALSSCPDPATCMGHMVQQMMTGGRPQMAALGNAPMAPGGAAQQFAANAAAHLVQPMFDGVTPGGSSSSSSSSSSAAFAPPPPPQNPFAMGAGMGSSSSSAFGQPQMQATFGQPQNNFAIPMPPPQPASAPVGVYCHQQVPQMPMALMNAPAPKGPPSASSEEPQYDIISPLPDWARSGPPSDEDYQGESEDSPSPKPRGKRSAQVATQKTPAKAKPSARSKPNAKPPAPKAKALPAKSKAKRKPAPHKAKVMKGAKK
eukprot:g13039.t1